MTSLSVARSILEHPGQQMRQMVNRGWHFADCKIHLNVAADGLIMSTTLLPQSRALSEGGWYYSL